MHVMDARGKGGEGTAPLQGIWGWGCAAFLRDLNCRMYSDERQWNGIRLRAVPSLGAKGERFIHFIDIVE